MRYRICPWCGAALDPGERCDCLDQETEKAAGGAGTSDSGMENLDTVIVTEKGRKVNEML